MRIEQYVSELANNIQSLYSVKCTISVLDSDRECVAIRVMPSGNTRFYDENRAINLTFQLLVKAEKQSRTAMLIGLISEYINKTGADIYTEPSYLQHDEQGYIYTASFNTTI